jgi:hypothetical protein
MLFHGFPFFFLALVVIRIVISATRSNRRTRNRADRLARRGYQPSGLGVPSGMPFPGQVLGDPYATGQPFPGDPYVAGQPFPDQVDRAPFVADQPLGGGPTVTTAPDPVHEDSGRGQIPAIPDPVPPIQTFSDPTFSDPTFGGGFN